MPITKVESSQSRPGRTHISKPPNSTHGYPHTVLEGNSYSPQIPQKHTQSATMCFYRSEQHYKCGCKAKNKLIKECVKSKLLGPCKDTPERIVAEEGLSDIPYCPDCYNKECYKILSKGAAREDAVAEDAKEQGATMVIIGEVREKVRGETKGELHRFDLMFPGYC